VLDFDWENPGDAGQGEWIVLFMDDKSVNAGRMETVFYKAVELL